MYTCPCSEQRFLFNSCDGVCFQARSRSFHIARKCNNGMFFKSIKVKMQSAYQSAFRRFLFFFFSNPGLTYLLLALCYANVISSFVTVFIPKNVETNCSVVPITFPGMAIPNPIPGTDMGRVCGYKYKINYRPNRQPITGVHL